jgi:hypothetical protein
MLDKPNSPLRQRMIEDMTARRFKEKVQKDYVRHVRRFAAFLGRSPDTAKLHLATQQTGAPTIKSAVEPGQPDVGPSAQPRRAHGGARGRDRQAGVAAYVAAQFRHPSARTERRYQGYPGPARNSLILPANTGPRARFTIGSTRAAARWLRSSDD